jgi:hypothetical protein
MPYTTINKIYNSYNMLLYVDNAMFTKRFLLLTAIDKTYESNLSWL